MLSSLPIPTLFGTGVATNNPDGSPATLVTPGNTDSHYTITAAPQGATPGSAFATLVNGYPVGNPWLANDSNSQWISPQANQQTLEPSGIYTYITTFSLAGMNPSTATISGEVGVDDSSLAISLNGTPETAPSPNFSTLQPFSITTGFVAGMNTLEFDVGNGPAGGSFNPTGLRVDMSGTAASSTIGPTSQLIFSQQPSDAPTGSAISPAITVDLEDANGNIVTTDNSTVTLSLASGPSGASVGGTSTVAAVSGVTTFSDLLITTPGTYTLTATDGALTAATSGSFTVASPPGIGNLDPTFGTSGFVAHDVTLTSTAGLVVQNNGQSVIAGTSGSPGSEEFGITRYNADGSLDTTFGTNGITVSSFGGDDQAAAEALLPDGDILIAGTDTTEVNGQALGSQFALAEYTPAGALDTTFGNGAGYVLTSFSSTPDTLSNDLARALVVAPSGTIYVGGSSDANGNNPEFAIAAYTPSGSPSTPFGTNGQVIINYQSGGDSIGALALSARGELIAAGSTMSASSGVSSIAMAEFLTNGALDTKFGVKGRVIASVGGVDDGASALAVDRSSNILVGGYTGTGSAAAGTLSSNFLLLRYDSAGKLDRRFGSGGIVTTDFSQPAAITNLLIDADGTIVASGKTVGSLAMLSDSGLNLAAARYTARGQLDTSFNSTGTAIYNLSNTVATASLTSLSRFSSANAQAAFTQSSSSIPFDAISDLMTMFMQLTQSDQGTIAMVSGGDLADVGSNGINTVEAHIIAMGVDLAATLVASLPQAVVGGAKGTASVNIAEVGKELAAGTFAIELFASNNPYPASGQTPFQSIPANLKLKQGMARKLKLKFQYPSSLSAGSYYLVATVDTGTVRDLNPANNTSSSASTVRIAPPFVQLAGSGLTTPAFDEDKPALISFTLMNVGNETASATSAVEFFPSTNGTPTGPIILALTPLKLNLKPGASHVFKVKLVLPPAFPAGTYTLVALIDPANVFNDPNAATNFIVSGSMFVVG